MILRPFSLKKYEREIKTLSPKGLKKPTYIRLKTNRSKSSKTGRSLCSIEANKQSSSLGSNRILSHRKLISASSLDQKQNLTQRKCTVQSENIISNSKQYIKQQGGYLNKPKFHFNKYSQYRNDRLNTIQNQESEHIEKVLQIKENILKQFIGRFQQQLKQINQQKSSRQALVTHRMKTEMEKQDTTKKQRNKIKSIESNCSTINFNHCFQGKQNNPNQSFQVQKNKFQDYIKQIQHHKKKDQKIFIVKNHKKSLQNISISKIGETQNITSRASKVQPKNKLNLKQLFKHSKKYEPYLKQSSTLCLNPKNCEKIMQKAQNLQKSQFVTSPIQEKQKQNLRQSGYIDCSTIEKMNQSSFISQVGRKSLLKHLQNQSVKIMKQQQKKSKKCLAKMKNIFPSDFF